MVEISNPSHRPNHLDNDDALRSKLEQDIIAMRELTKSYLVNPPTPIPMGAWKHIYSPGDKVICITPLISVKAGGGSGWKLGKVFEVAKVDLNLNGNGEVDVLWPTNDFHGIYADWVVLVSEASEGGQEKSKPKKRWGKWALKK